MAALVTILIPAAGASSRMRGGDKLLELVDNIPQLRRVAMAGLAASDQVIVTLRVDDVARRACLADLPVTILSVANAALGMSASLQAARTTNALMILPADMPEITGTHLSFLIEEFDQIHILRATAADGTPGHPVIFPADLVPALQTLSGDAGAGSILRAHSERLRLIALPDQVATTDLDTPEDWAAWRALRR